jgi:hypothetical protein
MQNLIDFTKKLCHVKVFSTKTQHNFKCQMRELIPREFWIVAKYQWWSFSSTIIATLILTKKKTMIMKNWNWTSHANLKGLKSSVSINKASEKMKMGWLAEEGKPYWIRLWLIKMASIKWNSLLIILHLGFVRIIVKTNAFHSISKVKSFKSHIHKKIESEVKLTSLTNLKHSIARLTHQTKYISFIVN